MKLCKLVAKHGKAKKIIINAGYPEEWVILKQTDTNPYSERDGPWLYIRPCNQGLEYAMWVHATDDKNFLVGIE